MKIWASLLLTGFFGINVLAASVGVSQSTGRSKEFVDFDISGSAGNYNGQSYTELHAGINLNFTDSITWRNSLFKRIPSGGAPETNGLDSSLRLSHDIGPLNIYAGPGYRFTSDSDKNALLGEAGANLNVGRLTLGAGAKFLRYDKAQYDSSGAELKRDDLSYFIAISGGFGMGFGFGN
ncbi:MAG: hypothetical protein K0R29_350 [Pseudobdellovibrio sp.]|jgi:hypothetical protein|nr:hypothetical protein [Pseudobdellovibrio sp.]